MTDQSVTHSKCSETGIHALLTPPITLESANSGTLVVLCHERVIGLERKDTKVSLLTQRKSFRCSHSLAPCVPPLGSDVKART